MDIVNCLKEEDQLRFMSITRLKEQLTQSEKVHSFFSFAEKLITEMKKEERFGNAKAYQTVDDIRKILLINLSEDDKLFHTRNYFMASYLMCGMSFIDMAFLTVEDLKNGRVSYRRKKTSKLYDFIISEQLKQILEYYLKGKSKADFIFPIIKQNKLEEQYKDIADARKKYNVRLKLLAEKCGIASHLTSYVSRHSFATQAVLQNLPLQAVSQMLGHSSLATTQIYLKSLPNNVMDDYLMKMQIK